MIPNVFKKKTMAALLVGGILSMAAIACGVDRSDSNVPAAGGNNDDSPVPTPPPSGSIQSGYDAVRLALEAKGAVVVRSGEEREGIFNNPVTNVQVNGETVFVYEFPSAGEANAASLNVSSDGSIISREDTPPIAIDFQNRPHYYKQGNTIVVYTGADAEVINLLRETLGEEFAGDASPVDPGNAGEPDYETVVVPAPIDSVEVREDPDNPGHFTLVVTSGLPSGCARFEDISVEQTGELELTLTVLNRVPHPDLLMMCTMIYGIVENTVPLGSAQDNLDVCEVYKVVWQNSGNPESLKFQVTAPNVRCADPDLSDGGDDPAVSPIISDIDALILGLQNAGVDIKRSEEKGSDMFGVTSTVVYVNGERVELYSFGSNDRAIVAATGVSADGYSFDLSPIGGPVMQVSWISTPHFYLFGNSIVLYVGVNDGIIGALDRFAGQKFAGPGATPVELPADDPAPLPDPDLETVVVPAPVVSVGDVAVAESFPVQYFLNVRTAQPDGCHKDAGWEVEIGDDSVHVTVNNSRPANLAVVLCLAQYGETEQTIRLGTGNDFKSGAEYELFVNGEAHGTFTAQ